MTESIDVAIEKIVRRVVDEVMASRPSVADEVFTLEQAAKHQQVHTSTIRRWIARGEIKTLRADPVRILRSELERVSR